MSHLSHELPDNTIVVPGSSHVHGYASKWHPCQAASFAGVSEGREAVGLGHPRRCTAWFLTNQEVPPGSYRASSTTWAVDRGYFGMLMAGLVNSAASMLGAHFGAAMRLKPWDGEA